MPKTAWKAVVVFSAHGLGLDWAGRGSALSMDLAWTGPVASMDCVWTWPKLGSTGPGLGRERAATRLDWAKIAQDSACAGWGGGQH